MASFLSLQDHLVLHVNSVMNQHITTTTRLVWRFLNTPGGAVANSSCSTSTGEYSLPACTDVQRLQLIVTPSLGDTDTKHVGVTDKSSVHYSYRCVSKRDVSLTRLSYVTPVSLTRQLTPVAIGLIDPIPKSEQASDDDGVQNRTAKFYRVRFKLALDCVMALMLHLHTILRIVMIHMKSYINVHVVLYYKKVRSTNAYPDSNRLSIVTAHGVIHYRTASVLCQASRLCRGEGGMLSPDAVEVVVVSGEQEGDPQASEFWTACIVKSTYSQAAINLPVWFIIQSLQPSLSRVMRCWLHPTRNLHARAETRAAKQSRHLDHCSVHSRGCVPGCHRCWIWDWLGSQGHSGQGTDCGETLCITSCSALPYADT